MALAAASVFWAAPAFAQDEPEPESTDDTVLVDGEDAQPQSTIVRDDDTSDTVQRIRRDLIILAGVMTLALAVYVWHTSPPRRLAVASRRAAAVRATEDEIEEKSDQD